MLIAAPALLRRAQAAEAHAADLRTLFRRIHGLSAVPRDLAIGTFGAPLGALSVARHIAYL